MATRRISYSSSRFVFRQAEKNVNFIVVLIGMSTFMKLSPVDALGSYLPRSRDRHFRNEAKTFTET